MQLSDADLEEFGYAPSDLAPDLDWEARTVNTPDGPVEMQVPKGVGTGRAYNIGEAGFGRGADLLAQEGHGPWQALFAPGGSRPKKPGRLTQIPALKELGPSVRAGDEAGLRAALRSAIGGDEAVFVDPAGGRVAVNQSIADHISADWRNRGGRIPYLPLIPELIERPQEILGRFFSQRNVGAGRGPAALCPAGRYQGRPRYWPGRRHGRRALGRDNVFSWTRFAGTKPADRSARLSGRRRVSRTSPPARTAAAGPPTIGGRPGQRGDLDIAPTRARFKHAN